MPTIDQLSLEEPEIVKQSGGYGVKLKASAPSIHLIKAYIETEVSPMVGTELQSEELVQFLLKEFEEDPKRIWESNMFGKTLHELVREGLNNKIAHMPADARIKLSDTLQKVINEGSGGMICILL
jgi:stage IV sporulation protein A